MAKKTRKRVQVAHYGQATPIRTKPATQPAQAARTAHCFHGHTGYCKQCAGEAPAPLYGGKPAATAALASTSELVRQGLKERFGEEAGRKSRIPLEKQGRFGGGPTFGEWADNRMAKRAAQTAKEMAAQKAREAKAAERLAKEQAKAKSRAEKQAAKATAQSREAAEAELRAAKLKAQRDCAAAKALGDKGRLMKAGANLAAIERREKLANREGRVHTERYVALQARDLNTVRANHRPVTHVPYASTRLERHWETGELISVSRTVQPARQATVWGV